MPERINAKQAREDLRAGAMLVCAYNDTEKCEGFGIDPAIPYPELASRLDAVPESQELIFFCA